jgi:hypothetical protein
LIVTINTPQQADDFLQARLVSGARYAPGNCLGSMRDAYATGAFGGTAATAYAATTQRGTGAAPFGALLWWTGGQDGAGHTAFSLGDGYCLTTDFEDTGFIGDGRIRRVLIANITAHDALLTFRGWSRDLDGFTVLQEEPYMILVQKKDGGPIYHYTGDHIEAITAHQALRAQQLGAKLVILNDTDEIFSLTPPPYGTTTTSSVPKHSHPFSGTTASA